MMKIYIDGEFLMNCPAAHADSALDELDFEYNITDTHWTDRAIYLTSASGETDDELMKYLIRRRLPETVQFDAGEVHALDDTSDTILFNHLKLLKFLPKRARLKSLCADRYDDGTVLVSHMDTVILSLFPAS